MRAQRGDSSRSGQGQDTATPVLPPTGTGTPQIQHHTDQTSSPLAAAGCSGNTWLQETLQGRDKGPHARCPRGLPRTGPGSRARGGRTAPWLRSPSPHLGALSGAGWPQQHRADPAAEPRARRLSAATPRLRARSHGRHRLCLAGSRTEWAGSRTWWAGSRWRWAGLRGQCRAWGRCGCFCALRERRSALGVSCRCEALRTQGLK